MRKLLVYLNNYKKECVLGPLFKLLEALFELFVPLVIAALIDVGIGGGDKPYIIKMCIVLAALAFVGLLSSITAQFFAAKAACGFARNLKHALFAHLQTLSHTELDTLGTSTLITRMTSDMNQLQTGVNMALRLFLRSPFVVFGAMIMAFTIDVESALIFAVTIPILTVVVFAIILGTMPLYKKAQEKLDRVLGITRGNLKGTRVIRAFSLEEQESGEFKAKTEELSAVQKFVGGISALMNPVTYVIINAAILILIYVGAIRVDTGIITQGAVFALYNYMSQILIELIKLANLIVTLTKAVACGRRVSSVFEIKPSLESCGSATDGDGEYAVEFRGVSMKYKSAAEESLTGISFAARRGETVGIIGATGSGKSSLVNLIPRFYDAEDGSILINGVDVREYDVAALREKIAVVPQKAVLFKGSVRENMKWGNPDATDEEINLALSVAQATDVVAEKAGGLDAQVEQGGRNFSGGQRQRLTIARALVRRSEILILDDSASALDFATEAALRQAIRQLPSSPTVFTVSQRAASVMHADKILVLDDGMLVGCGTHEALLDTCDVYREIYLSQFRKEADDK